MQSLARDFIVALIEPYLSRFRSCLSNENKEKRRCIKDRYLYNTTLSFHVFPLTIAGQKITGVYIHARISIFILTYYCIHSTYVIATVRKKLTGLPAYSCATGRDWLHVKINKYLHISYLRGPFYVKSPRA